MARTKRSTKKQETEIQDYRHDTTRTNNPPAGIASHGRVHEQPKQEYAYNPHLPPSLRFDENGDADQLPELLAKAQQGPLSADEVQILAEALRHHNPWLEWSGKQEAESFSVDPVALHIHERVSAKAIVKIAERENVQRELFADPQLDYLEAVQFYRHDVDWTNRPRRPHKLILIHKQPVNSAVLYKAYLKLCHCCGSQIRNCFTVRWVCGRYGSVDRQFELIGTLIFLCGEEIDY